MCAPPHPPLPRPAYTPRMQLTPPPRVVPSSLKVVNFFNPLVQIGWAVFGFGMFFFWAFVMNADLSFLTFRGPYAVVDGKITEVVETNASVNKQRVRENHYEYSVAGVRRTGTSYSHGSAPSVGEIVPVEYSESDPSQSRIEGMRRAMFPGGLILVAIFPLIGLALVLGGTSSGVKRNYLLREGLLANGTLKSKSPTNMTVNKRRVYELCFEFITRDGRRCELKTRTSLTEKLENDDQEPLLYDPANPDRAYMLDDAPARPELEPNGDLRGRPKSAVLSLILPLIVIAGHGAYLLKQLGML